MISTQLINISFKSIKLRNNNAIYTLSLRSAVNELNSVHLHVNLNCFLVFSFVCFFVHSVHFSFITQRNVVGRALCVCAERRKSFNSVIAAIFVQKLGTKKRIFCQKCRSIWIRIEMKL